MDASLPVQKTSTVNKGYLIALVGTTIWSSTAIFIRYLTETYQMPPLVLAFWRDLLVAAGLAVVFVLAAPKLLRAGRRNLGFLLLYGLILSLFNWLWTVSVALNGAAVSTVLAYSSAAYTAVLGWRFLHERLDRVKATAVVLSLAGCVLVSGAYDPAAWSLNLVGILTGLLSGVAFACYSLMGKAAAGRDLPPWTTMLYIFGFAAIFLGVYNMATGWLAATGWIAGPTPGLFFLRDRWLGWGALLLLAFVPTVGGYGLYTVSLTYLPASVANLIATLEPSLTAIQAYFFLGERFSFPQLLGSLLIIAGVVLIRLNNGGNGDAQIGETASTQRARRDTKNTKFFK